MAKNTNAAPPTQSKPRTVKAVATRTGYYGLRRIREGQTFDLTLYEGQEMPSWAEPVGREGAAPQRSVGQAPPPPPGADETRAVI